MSRLTGSTATVSLPRWSVGVLEVSATPTIQTKVQPTYAQPDVLKMQNGQTVRDPQSWWRDRRPEILELLETQEYGRMPGGKAAGKVSAKFRLDLIDRKALAGKAIRKQVTISFPNVKDSPKLHLLLYVPAKTSGASTEGARSTRVLKIASSPSMSGSTWPLCTRARLESFSTICRDTSCTG